MSLPEHRTGYTLLFHKRLEQLIRCQYSPADVNLKAGFTYTLRISTEDIPRAFEWVKDDYVRDLRWFDDRHITVTLTENLESVAKFRSL